MGDPPKMQAPRIVYRWPYVYSFSMASKPKKHRLGPQLRVYLSPNDHLGPGKADIMELIAKTGSIVAAGKAMDMSYRRAWLLVDAMNRCWAEPLVETSPGSAKGGGARLTALGTAVLQHYRALQDRLQGTSDCEDYKALASAMLPEPKASQKA